MRFSKSAILIVSTGIVMTLVGVPAPSGPSPQISFEASASARSPCGGAGQRACIAVVDGGPVGCRKGLVERTTNPIDPTAGRCYRPSNAPKGTVIDGARDVVTAPIKEGARALSSADAIGIARRSANQLRPIANRLNDIWRDCAPRIGGFGSLQNQSAIDTITGLPCFQQTTRLARESGYRTLTLSLYTEAAAVVGGAEERGVAFDLGGQFAPSTFTTSATQYLSIGRSAGVTVGLFYGTNQPGSGGFGGPSVGVSGTIKLIKGGGMATWISGRRVSGLSVSVGKGIGGGLAVLDANTLVRGGNFAGPSGGARGGQPDYAEPEPYEYRRVRTQPGSLAQYEYADQQTEVQFCNRSRETINFAFGYYDWGYYSPAANWSSVGWWELPRGQCAFVGVPDQQNGSAYFGEIFVVGKGTNRRWEARDGIELCAPSGEAFHFANTETKDCHIRDVMIGIRHVAHPDRGKAFIFE